MGVAVPLLEATLPGGRPLFLAGCCEVSVVSSAFLLLFIMPGLEDDAAAPRGFDLLLSLSPPDLEVCDVVSSSEELEELSESELSESEELDSILFTFFFTAVSSCFFAGFSCEVFEGAGVGLDLPGAFFTWIMLTGGAGGLAESPELTPFTSLFELFTAGLEAAFTGPGFCLTVIMLTLGAGPFPLTMAGLSLTGLADFLPGLTFGSTIPVSFSITILDLDSELELCIWNLPKLSQELPF